MTERVLTDANGRKYITTEPFKPDYNTEAVLVEEMQHMKRPIESNYTSHVAYTRALEEYCDAQGFEPDWADFANGKAAGRAEAFEQIADKMKEMPWENDTKDSFLIWLKEQK